MKRLFAITCAVIAILSAPLKAEPIIGMAFPPVAENAQRQFSISALKDLRVGHIRIAESWARRPLRPAARDFGPLVDRLRELYNADLEILLTVELNGPAGACEETAEHACRFRADAPFEDYLATLIGEVSPYIAAIQIGNEWDNRFPGTTDQFLEVYARATGVIRSRVPNLPIILGGITGRAPYMFAICEIGSDPLIPNFSAQDAKQLACEKERKEGEIASKKIARVLDYADYDAVDVHLYDAPGLWSASIDWIRIQMKKPIWVTEFGGPNPEIEPDTPIYQAQRLQVYLDTIAKLPVQRAYYFKLTDDDESYHSRSGLYDMTGREKPSLLVFKGWRDAMISTNRNATRSNNGLPRASRRPIGTRRE